MTFNNRGNLFRAKGKLDRAIADHDEAIRLDARNALAYSNRGFDYESKKEYSRAMADYLEAMRLVVPIRTDVEVRAWQAERDEADLGELAERYRLTGPVRRLREALSQERPSERR